MVNENYINPRTFLYPGIMVTCYGSRVGWLKCDGTRYKQLDYLSLYRVLKSDGFAVSDSDGLTFVLPNIANTIIKT
jgi:hypothetical protein